MLRVAFRIYIIILEALNGHAFFVGEGLHAFFLAFHRVFVRETGSNHFLDRDFCSKANVGSVLEELGLALHVV